MSVNWKALAAIVAAVFVASAGDKGDGLTQAERDELQRTIDDDSSELE